MIVVTAFVSALALLTLVCLLVTGVTWLAVGMIGEASPPAVGATPAPTPTPVARNADWTPVIETVDGVEMVYVPPGCFTMGHSVGRRDERPAHQQCITDPFWLDRYEVTNAQYGDPGVFPLPEQPRTNLTWFEAREHCEARGGRLPTEAEWEYAARGPSSFLYPWGNNWELINMVSDRSGLVEPAEVGSREGGVSWVGAYDLAGNAWEWVSSLYQPYPYEAADGRENLAEPAGWRVYRGGRGTYIDHGASAAKRFRAAPDYRDWFIGFRCIREVAAE